MAQEMEDASSAARQQAAQGQAAQYGTFETPYSPRRYDWRPPPPVVPVFWW